MNDFNIACWYWSGSLVAIILSLICSLKRRDSVLEIFANAYISGMLSWIIPIIVLLFLPQYLALRGTGAGAWRTLP